MERQTNKGTLSADDIGSLLLLASILLGAWFRIFPPLEAGFPINDGGLFYAMIEALQNNGFRIPQFVEYNGLQIPFAYPPLGFYIAAGVGTVFGIDIFTILRWMPAIVLIGTIPSMYALSKAMLNSNMEAGLAAFIYALLPRSITWLIMGGGITRSVGQLFLILATLNLYRMYAEGKRKFAIGAVIFCSLVVVTHPEATIHTIGIAIALALLHARNRRGFLQTGLVGAGALAVTSPWWASMLVRHGLAPFVSASQSGFHDFKYFYAFFIDYTQETFIPLIAVFAWIGVLYFVSKREYTLPLLFALPFLIEPRNAPNVGMITIPMLASHAIFQVLLPALRGSQTKDQKISSLIGNTSQKLCIAVVTFCLFVGMQIFGMEMSAKRIHPETRLAFEWVKAHTPPSSRFVILSGNRKPLEDFNNEWFPILTDRVSLTTLQGLEWDNSIDFNEHTMWLSNAQNCRFSFDAPACLRALGLSGQLQFDYLIILRATIDPPLYLADLPSWANAEGRSLVYESSEIFILRFP